MVLDATVGGSAANSYLTLAAANLLNLDRLGPQAARWAAATDSDREKALIQATIDIDALVHVGLPWDNDQALRFPRAVDINETGVTFIPPRIGRATYEQAAYLLSNAELLDKAASRRARGLYSFDEDGGPSGTLALDSQLGLIAPRAQALLTGFVATTAAGRGRIGSVRLRSRFATPTYTSLD